MRFYLDSARAEEIREAAAWPWVSGVTTNPAILERAGLSSIDPVLEAAVATGRRDWSLWVQLPRADAATTVQRAHALRDRLARLTGGPFAGPTLVVKLLPVVEHLWAAALLVSESVEVCITGVCDAFQALALTRLPRIAADEAGSGGIPTTDGPPASRQPGAPDSVAVYVGRISDHGQDGPRELWNIAYALHKGGRRTRVLAASVRDWGLLAPAMQASEYGTLDVALNADMLREILDNPVTAASMEQFAQLEAGFRESSDS